MAPLNNQPPEPQDPYHYDGVYCGPPVPFSVFYRRRHPEPDETCRTLAQLIVSDELKREIYRNRDRKQARERMRQRRGRR